MSEYQYYEFQAIDRPLDERAMAALRALTSRAEITPTRLVNVYHFGDFKGDPDRLMDQYFDAFLYVANWGTRRFMLRLPGRTFDLAAAKPYLVPDVLRARATKEHVILAFCSQEEGGDWEDGPGWLASLIPLHADLLAGDLRCLYLGWLAGVQSGEVDEDQVEPPVPPGLHELSGALQRFAEFLRVDPALIEAATAASPGAALITPSSDEWAAWVAALPEAEKNQLLLRVVQGQALHLGSELLQRFRQEQSRLAIRSVPSNLTGPARRTVKSLLAAREALVEERHRRAAKRTAKEQARRAREQAAARARHLDALVGQEEKLWRQVETAIGTRQPREYDRAVELLKDLRDLAQRTGADGAMMSRLRRLRERHGAKRTLIQRLDRAGFAE